MSSVGTLSDKSLLLSTVQMDNSQQQRLYHVITAVVNIYINYFTTTLAESILIAGPIVVVTFTDFM